METSATGGGTRYTSLSAVQLTGCLLLSKGKYITHAWHAKDTVTERASKILVRETFSWLESVFDGENLIESSAA